MVQKSKGGKKNRSVQAGKKAKNEMKHNRKKNYKKKVVKKIECSVCMEEVVDTRDNTITCGKVNHALCRDCKMKCEDCPMCRSHKVQKPISQTVELRVLQKNQNSLKREKILVKGMKIHQHDIGEGIYEKISEWYQKPVYKHKTMELYLYQDYWDIWTLNNVFERDCECCIAESELDIELLGNHKWNMGICGYKKQVSKSVNIKKIK